VATEGSQGKLTACMNEGKMSPLMLFIAARNFGCSHAGLINRGDTRGWTAAWSWGNLDWRPAQRAKLNIVAHPPIWVRQCFRCPPSYRCPTSTPWMELRDPCCMTKWRWCYNFRCFDGDPGRISLGKNGGHSVIALCRFCYLPIYCQLSLSK